MGGAYISGVLRHVSPRPQQRVSHVCVYTHRHSYIEKVGGVISEYPNTLICMGLEMWACLVVYKACACCGRNLCGRRRCTNVHPVPRGGYK